MILHGILFFFFFRLITDFVEAIYAFGLLGTSIPPEIVAVLFLLAPASLLFRRQTLSKKGLVLIGALVLISGAVEGLYPTRGRMFISGIGTASLLIFFPSLLAYLAGKRNASYAGTLAAGLALGLALFILLGAWNSGLDPSGQPVWQGGLWLLAAVGLLLLPSELNRAGAPPETGAGQPQQASFGRTAGLSLGLISALTLLYFAFASPNVLARWTGANYQTTLGFTVFALSLFAVLIATAARGRIRLTPAIILAWNVLFVGFVVLAILPHQLTFPAGPAGYPFYEPPVNTVQVIPFYLMIILFPILLLDFALYAQELIALRPGIRKLGGSFSLAALFLIHMIFAQVFTTVYDYIPFIGPFFRDRFWLVFFILGLSLAIPSLLIRQNHPLWKASISYAFAGGMVVMSIAALTGAVLLAAKPEAQPVEKTSLRILTYNIQQGYSSSGEKSHAEQLELIRQVDADLIGLQESDTNRISGGNSDLIRYFADRLDLYSYYGPKVVPGTFGIALLSKYPIENPRTYYLYSQGEQTAAISAEIRIQGKTSLVFVTHLGNGGPMVQLENFLAEVPGLPDAPQTPVITMGDFNFTPDTGQYRKATSLLKDAWLLRWPSGKDDQGNELPDRIDHIFISSGIEVQDARYLTGPQSDHPAFFIDIQP